jgi:hypothetical protein
MHYYNTLLLPYRHRLEEKNVDNLGSALQTCLEFEEQLARTGLPSEDYVKQNDMSIVLQLVQDMSNQMISFERKGVTSTSTPTETSAQASFRNQPTNFQSNSTNQRLFFQDFGAIFVMITMMRVPVRSKREQRVNLWKKS